MWKAASSVFWHMNQPKDILCIIAVAQGYFWRWRDTLLSPLLHLKLQHSIFSYFSKGALPGQLADRVTALHINLKLVTDWKNNISRHPGYKPLSVKCLSPTLSLRHQNVFTAFNCAAWCLYCYTEHYCHCWLSWTHPCLSPMTKRPVGVIWLDKEHKLVSIPHTCRPVKCQYTLQRQDALLIDVSNATNDWKQIQAAGWIVSTCITVDFNSNLTASKCGFAAIPP